MSPLSHANLDFHYGQYKMQTGDCLLSRNNLTMSSPIKNTITLSLFLSLFYQKCYFTAWFGTDLFLVVERSKDITHVKLLPSLVAKISDICDVNVNSLFIIHDTRHLHAA